jgi:hypothetical protein
MANIFAIIDVQRIVLKHPAFTPAPVVPPRPPDYDPDKRWDEETGTWLDIQGAGGGRYQESLVIIGDAGEIFVGSV